MESSLFNWEYYSVLVQSKSGQGKSRFTKAHCETNNVLRKRQIAVVYDIGQAAFWGDQFEVFHFKDFFAPKTFDERIGGITDSYLVIDDVSCYDVDVSETIKRLVNYFVHHNKLRLFVIVQGLFKTKYYTLVNNINFLVLSATDASSKKTISSIQNSILYEPSERRILGQCLNVFGTNSSLQRPIFVLISCGGNLQYNSVPPFRVVFFVGTLGDSIEFGPTVFGLFPNAQIMTMEERQRTQLNVQLIGNTLRGIRKAFRCEKETSSTINEAEAGLFLVTKLNNIKFVDVAPLASQQQPQEKRRLAEASKVLLDSINKAKALVTSMLAVQYIGPALKIFYYICDSTSLTLDTNGRYVYLGGTKINLLTFLYQCCVPAFCVVDKSKNVTNAGDSQRKKKQQLVEGDSSAFIVLIAHLMTQVAMPYNLIKNVLLRRKAIKLVNQEQRAIP